MLPKKKKKKKGEKKKKRIKGIKKNSLPELIGSKALPPFFIRLPHLLGLDEIELSSPQEAEEGGVVVPVVARSVGDDLWGERVGWTEPGGDEVRPEMGQSGLLLGGAN